MRSISIKQQLLALVLIPFLLLAVTLSIVLAKNGMESAGLAALEKARSDLATGEKIFDLMYPGPWEAREGLLYKGGTRISGTTEAVDKIASLTGDTVTVFLGDTRISTTVKNDNGKRAIGTKASEIVGALVLKNGEVYLGEANVVGETYQTAYKPVRDINGNIIGMFYVGINKTLFSRFVMKNLFIPLSITLLVTVLVAIAALIFAQKIIIKPIQQIIMGTRELAVGHGSKINLQSHNEIGELASAFNQMVEGLEKISVKIEKTNALLVEKDTSVSVAAAPRIPLSQEELPKGLNDATLRQIISYLEKNESQLSSEEVGAGVNITRVTARRYLEYLEQLGRVSGEVKYGTIGRPVKLYIISPQE